MAPMTIGEAIEKVHEIAFAKNSIPDYSALFEEMGIDSDEARKAISEEAKREFELLLVPPAQLGPEILIAMFANFFLMGATHARANVGSG